jgi:hypothetical protein
MAQVAHSGGGGGLARQMGEKEEFGVLVLRRSLPGDADEHAKFMGARHCRVIVVLCLLMCICQ